MKLTTNITLKKAVVILGFKMVLMLETIKKLVNYFIL